MNEKRTHIKKTSFILKNFFNPIQKKIAIRKKTNSPTTHSTNNPIHSTKTFFTNQQEKTFLFLKKQDTENLTKNGGKKPMIVFHQIIEKKNHQMNKKNNLKSDKTLHNLPACKNRSNHVQEKN